MGEEDMFTGRIMRHSAALAVLGFLTAAGSAQAATYNLNYAGSPVYCSGGCLTATYPTAGTVDVTVVSAADDYLHFHVDLATGWRFLDNHGTTFAFSLDVAGASIVNVVGNNGATYGAPQTNVDAGDGVGDATHLFGYGLLGTNFHGGGHVNSDDLVFDVKKTGVDLSLANLILTQDKNGNFVLFIADVGNPDGTTGFVGALNICTNCAPPPPSETPIPGALPLFTSGMGVLGFLGWRRKRRLARQAA
jgi:hypothetical protein